MSKELLVGSPAPALALAGFVKGGAFTALAPGRIYVIEFWATWCGPCRTSIPHLSALQSTYPEVCFLGVAVMDTETAVRDFVREQQDGMAYHIALDMPGDKPRGEGPTHRAWCQAAYCEGIPAAFIVNGEGRIAWIGHPMRLDGPLASLAEGRWDIEAEAEAHRARLDRDMVRQTKSLTDALRAQQGGGDLRASLTVYDEHFALHPELESKWGVGKLGVLMDLGEGDPLGYARHLVAGTAGDDPALRNVLHGLANLVLHSSRHEKAIDPTFLGWVIEQLERAAAADDAGPGDALSRMRLLDHLGRLLLIANRPGDSIEPIQMARRLAVEADAPEYYLKDLDALLEQCMSDVSPSTPVVECDGASCRIVG